MVVPQLGGRPSYKGTIRNVFVLFVCLVQDHSRYAGSKSIAPSDVPDKDASNGKCHTRLRIALDDVVACLRVIFVQALNLAGAVTPCTKQRFNAWSLRMRCLSQLWSKTGP